MCVELTPAASSGDRELKSGELLHLEKSDARHVMQLTETETDTTWHEEVEVDGDLIARDARGRFSLDFESIGMWS